MKRSGGWVASKREYGVIRFGTDRLIAAANDDPSVLEGNAKRSDIRAASELLEGTYLIRLFAEFETALEHFVRAFNLRKPRTTEALINRVRDRARIPQPDTDAVHRTRLYRNVLVHRRTDPIAPVTIREATKFLCTFLSRLQRIW